MFIKCYQSKVHRSSIFNRGSGGAGSAAGGGGGEWAWPVYAKKKKKQLSCCHATLC